MSPQISAKLFRLISVAFFLTGLIWTLPAFAPIGGPGVFLLDLLKWPLDGNPSALSEDARWMCGVGGGLLASLAAMGYLIVAPALERGDGEARRGAIIAIVIWYVVDSAGSIAAGVASNAVFNTVFAALYLYPLVAAKLGAPGRTQIA